MAEASQLKRWTERELLELPEDGNDYEVIDGELVVTPGGFEHSRVGMRLIFAMEDHVRKHRLGVVCGPDLGCWMSSGDCLSPDASFISKARARELKEPEKFFPGSPDVVVEVLSPSHRPGVTRRKIAQYLANGALLAWVINSKERSVTVYRSNEPEKILRPGEILDGDPVLKGFRYPVADLFASPLSD